MTEYLEIDITLISKQQEGQELFLALLADFGFEGFREESGRIIAYIPGKNFSRENFELFLLRHRLNDKVKVMKTIAIPDRNWNAIWEMEYSPVRFGSKCIVRAPFHPAQEDTEHDLVISPKMSFGTAHHETTRLMIEFILARDWTGQKVLDFGCGTGVLAILADKMGAGQIIALDNDPWAYRNALENIGTNGCKNIKVLLGELEILKEKSFDTILGNVNLNVLVSEMQNMSCLMEHHGIAMLSGFYEHDLENINHMAGRHGLTLLENHSLNEWTVAVYRKGD